MKIYFERLILICRESREKIDLSHQINYFHGKISAGKSSIVRLIDYCLGGKLEKTKAISQELISAQLLAKLGKYEVIFERRVNDRNQVSVTWKDSLGRSASVIAPIQATEVPIWEQDVYNISDLIFYLCGQKPIKVRKSKLKENSDLVRLSFRDLMWYCYLDQDNLDSSFYNLMDIGKRYKSRDAIRFVIGYYTDEMNDLEILIEDLRTKRSGKLESTEQIKKFLKDFGFNNATDIRTEIAKSNEELGATHNEIEKLRTENYSSAHFADSLRQELREFSKKLFEENQVLNDLEERIDEQESLKAELISTKFKLSKTETANTLLEGVVFETCPACGNAIKGGKKQNDDFCYLCGSGLHEINPNLFEQSGLINEDLNSRIFDLAESINHHKVAKDKQEKYVSQLIKDKSELDRRLNSELENYDSSFLSQAREYEKKIGMFRERIHYLENMIKIPESISAMEREADELLMEIQAASRKLKEEIGSLQGAEEIVREIEDAYLDAISSVGIPGIQLTDKVKLSKTNWIPEIISVDGEPYSFYNAGSGGKKTLLNVCYAIAVHRIAAKHDLPLPTFLMIDTPMKNIGEDVNREIFKSFYEYLYDLAENDLRSTQFVIIDKEYFDPNGRNINVYDKFMSPDEPLISYYRGP